MNKQEQIEKMAQEGRDNLIATNYQGKTDIERLCKALYHAGYINGADFVEWLKEKYGDLFYEIVLRETGYPYREQVDLDKALQEYLKGE